MKLSGLWLVKFTSSHCTMQIFVASVLATLTIQYVKMSQEIPSLYMEYNTLILENAPRAPNCGLRHYAILSMHM